MKHPKELTSSNFQPDDQVVSDYLLSNPEFFIRNARQVEKMMIPHTARGAVSLVEWQLARQRHQITQLEEEITLLMEQAHANQQLFDRIFALQGQLAGASDLEGMIARLHDWALELGLAGADIRLFSNRWRLDSPYDYTRLALSARAFEPVRIARLGDQRHYLGRLNSSELQLLLPHVKATGSVAMSLIGREEELGVLIFTSCDAQHYQNDMGTALLQHLAVMVPEILTRWIERA